MISLDKFGIASILDTDLISVVSGSESVEPIANATNTVCLRQPGQGSNLVCPSTGPGGGYNLLCGGSNTVCPGGSTNPYC